jgi:hypothetical protein
VCCWNAQREGDELSPAIDSRPWHLRVEHLTRRNGVVFFVAVHPRNWLRVSVTICIDMEVTVTASESADLKNERCESGLFFG